MAKPGLRPCGAAEPRNWPEHRLRRSGRAGRQVQRGVWRGVMLERPGQVVVVRQSWRFQGDFVAIGRRLLAYYEVGSSSPTQFRE